MLTHWGWEHVTDDCPSHCMLGMCNWTTLSKGFSEVHHLLQLWCAQGQPEDSCPVWSQLLWPQVSWVWNSQRRWSPGLLTPDYVSYNRWAVKERTWPSLEKAAAKGLDDPAGLVKAVGLSKKFQDKHNTSKSPHGSRFYRLSLRIQGKFSGDFKSYRGSFWSIWERLDNSLE